MGFGEREKAIQTVAEMLQIPDLQPVEFAPGAIGNARPLRVSPQHRILLNDWRAQVFFGEDEVPQLLGFENVFLIASPNHVEADFLAAVRIIGLCKSVK